MSREDDGVADHAHGQQIVITLASGVKAAYASQCQYQRSLRLAQARQQIATEGVALPTWSQLTEDEQQTSALEARNWLLAGERADLVARCPVHP